MSRATVSVIIPTHNRPESLARAMTSVESQTRQPHEVIVVDDGSVPPVDATVFDHAPYPIRLVHNSPALGAAAARNAGVREATGTFIAFIDDDDTWASTKLEFVEACLDAHPDTDVVIHRTGYAEPQEPQRQACARIGEPLERMIRSQPPHLDGVVVRRAVHIDTPFDNDLTAAEDLDYLIRLAKSGAAMVESAAVLAVFGEDEPSVIGIDSRIEGRLELLQRHPDILADHRATAFFYVRLGHLQRRGGMRSAAIRSFLTALRSQPTSRTAWKGLVRTVLA